MTVTEYTYGDDMYAALNRFYLNYIEPSVPVQVFQSFTYGELVICTLLLMGLILYALKWLWEVLR